MNLLHLPPVHIPALFHLLQPRQVRVSLDHSVDALAHCFLVDVPDVDFQSFNGLDDDIALGDQLALAQGLVRLALTLSRLPDEAVTALLVTLLLEVLDPFEADRAAARQRQVAAAFQLRRLVELVTAAEQR